MKYAYRRFSGGNMEAQLAFLSKMDAAGLEYVEGLDGVSPRNVLFRVRSLDNSTGPRAAVVVQGSVVAVVPLPLQDFVSGPQRVSLVVVPGDARGPVECHVDV